MREVNSCDFCGEAAAGTFQVVPPERDPTGEGRRMVLCGGCRDTLGDVLDPLLGGAHAGGGDREETGSATTVVAEPERESETPGRDGSPAGGGRASVGEASAGTTTDADLGEALGEEMPGGASPSGTDDGGVEERGGGSRSAGRGTPRGYRKVMRFLENREFPMDREEAETLAAEAYGMDRESVSAVIDHAVKHNRLREASGDLRQ